MARRWPERQWILLFVLVFVAGCSWAWSSTQWNALGISGDCRAFAPRGIYNADKDGTVGYRIDDPSAEALFVACMRGKHPEVPLHRLARQSRVNSHESVIVRRRAAGD